MINQIKYFIAENKKTYNNLIANGTDKSYLDYIIKSDLNYSISDYDNFNVEEMTAEQLETLHDNLMRDFEDLNVIEEATLSAEE